ncbi:hypothetical protein GOP47_0002049 [Adiantum capillus-veneris]|uniref:Uncharacterized protein n=1 Tax=Adiantum capillus-veneris TaxID=13818 RepID=A0A9D4V9E9_ADICA|nr:hypothetical protein GOP47_0002049 [Adiantum capillus-veneris]
MQSSKVGAWQTVCKVAGLRATDCMQGDRATDTGVVDDGRFLAAWKLGLIGRLVCDSSKLQPKVLRS